MNRTVKSYIGIDMGSVAIKAVLVDPQRKVLASALQASGGNYQDSARKILESVLCQADISMDQVAGMVVTGLGADRAPFDARQISDISSQAMGCYQLFPSAHTVIDIGGQFTKALRISQGRVVDFLMSEKCATGSGRFLQVIARILHVDLEDIGALSLKSQNPAEFSTNCAVFAESETVSRIAEGARPEDILAGVHRAMASKVAMLVKRVRMEPDVVITGGGGADAGLVKAIGSALGVELLVPVSPRLSAAFGAACLAVEDDHA